MQTRHKRTAKPRSLGEALHTLRTAAGFSQAELADAAGVPINTLRNLEQGVNADPQLSTAAKLARALCVRVDDLAALV